MRNILKILFFAIIISIAPTKLFCQLYGINYDATNHTNYAVDDKYDSIYIYNANEPEKNLSTRSGILKAIPTDSTKGWTFAWSKYDFKIHDYSDTSVISSDSMSILNNIKTGGYRVIMNKSITNRSDTFRAWVFINKLRLHLKKTDKNEVRALTYFCKYLPLGIIDKNNGQDKDSLRFIHDNFNYEFKQNTKTLYKYTLENSITVDWTANPDFTMDYTFNNEKLQIFIHNAPVPDGTDTTVFTINFKDKFGNSATDFVKYKTQNTKADFDIYGTDSLPAYKLKDTTGDAPFYAYFKNKSKRGVKFEWTVADTIAYNKKDSIHFITTDIYDSGKYTYYLPKTYPLKLVSTSPEGCTDTLSSKTIIVKESQLGKDSLRFPNAFTPGLENNRYFTYKAETWISVRNLHLLVFNQWGKLVYEFNGPVVRGWHGWDGTIGNLKLEARPGIYFYKYEALGWGPFGDGSSSNPTSTGTSGPTGTNTGTSTTQKKQGPINLHGNGFVYLFR